MPAAMGISAAGTIQNMLVNPSGRPIAWSTSPTPKLTNSKAAANVTHLSWRRCAPRADRNLSPKATRAAIRHGPTAAVAIVPIASKPDAMRSMANGLRTEARESSKWAGAKAFERTIATLAATISHRRTRQRDDGGRPSGKSKKNSAGTAKNSGIQIQAPIHAIAAPPGSDPGRAKSAKRTYAKLKAVTSKSRPWASNSQPIALPGRRAATSAPMRADVKTIAKNARSPTSMRGPRAAAPEPDKTWNAKHRTRARPQRDQATVDAVRVVTRSILLPGRVREKGRCATGHRRRETDLKASRICFRHSERGLSSGPR